MESPSKFMIADRGLTEQQMREKLAREDRQGWRRGKIIKNAIFDSKGNDLCDCVDDRTTDTILRMAHSFDGLVEALEAILDGVYRADGSLDAAMNQAREALRAANLEELK